MKPGLAAVAVAVAVAVTGCFGATAPTPTPDRTTSRTPTESSTVSPGLTCTPWPSEWVRLVAVNESDVHGEVVAFENLSSGYRRAARKMLDHQRVYRRHVPEFPRYVRKNGTDYELAGGMVGDHCTQHAPPSPYPTERAGSTATP